MTLLCCSLPNLAGLSWNRMQYAMCQAYPHFQPRMVSTLSKTVEGYCCPSVLDHPGLLIVKQGQCSPSIPASGPVFVRIYGFHGTAFTWSAGWSAFLARRH